MFYAPKWGGDCRLQRRGNDALATVDPNGAYAANHWHRYVKPWMAANQVDGGAALDCASRQLSITREVGFGSFGGVVTEGSFVLRPIGWVESSLVDPDAAPKQGAEGAPEAWLVFEPDVIEGLRDLHVNSEVIVLTWLHRGRRDVLRVHPRDDPANPMQGVFSTRSADRPNPIGLHRVEIVAIDRTRVHVRNLEAIDGTPIVDVKPVLDRARDR
jgi:tRNA-Thr(GGU) m(6)t(6)A37 methyltransferase TsaA